MEILHFMKLNTTSPLFPPFRCITYLEQVVQNKKLHLMGCRNLLIILLGFERTPAEELDPSVILLLLRPFKTVSA